MAGIEIAQELNRLFEEKVSPDASTPIEGEFWNADVEKVWRDADVSADGDDVSAADNRQRAVNRVRAFEEVVAVLVGGTMQGGTHAA